jgi:membrane associated rhomboid family serine protease
MFPLSDSIRSGRFPFLNYFLIALTVYAFFIQLGDPEGIIAQYALTPSRVDFTNYMSLLPFVTAIFLHGGFLHILSNMWFLKIFGDNVEGHLHSISFLLLYFLAGIGGNLAQYLLMPDTSIPLVGASGAVAGVLGCYYILFPHARIKTVLVIFFFVTVTNVSAAFMLGYWFLIQIVSAVGSVPGLGTEGGVAFFAHVGGFVIGILFGMIYKNRRGQILTEHYE